MRKQLNRERKLAAELQLKSERDRNINSIIAHEIKSPFHNLKNKYSDSIDIARIDTALEAILRIDQAVQSSSDEVFIVIEGRMNIEFRDGAVDLKEGDLYVVPKGVEHKPFAENECKIMLVEPRGVINTGDVAGKLTAHNDVWV